MVSAKEAKEWGQENLKGLFDALYTPFNGEYGNEIDYDGLRKLVRHSLDTLKHDGIYVTGTMGEFWAMTKDERKKVAEVAIDEANKVNPKAIKVVQTSCLPPKDALELTQHAQKIGADLVALLTPYYEAWGAPGVREYVKYIAGQTDIPIALYNSASTGLILSAKDVADFYKEFPAICAIKNSIGQPRHSMEIHSLAPKLVIWETDIIAAGSGGLMQRGIVSPVMLGNVGYALDTPGKMIYTEYWNLLMKGKLTEATHFFYDSGLADLMDALMSTSSCPYRPGYIGHWGSAIKYVGSLLGLPTGDFPHSRPPQPPFPIEMRQCIIDAYVKAGFIEKST